MRHSRVDLLLVHPLPFLHPRRRQRELLAELGGSRLRVRNLGFGRGGDHLELRGLCVRRHLRRVARFDVAGDVFRNLNLRSLLRQRLFPSLVLLEELRELGFTYVRGGEGGFPAGAFVRHVLLCGELFLGQPHERGVRLVELRLGLGVHGLQRGARVGVARRGGEHGILVRVRGGVLGRLFDLRRVGAGGGGG